MQKALFGKKTMAVLAALTVGAAGSAWAVTQGSVTRDPADSVIQDSTRKLYVDIGQIARFAEPTAGSLFNAGANGKTIDLVLGNAVWVGDRRNVVGGMPQAVAVMRRVANAVYFSFVDPGAIGTLCTINYGALGYASWGGGHDDIIPVPVTVGPHPEIITLPLAATCADDQPRQQLNIDFSVLMSDVSPGSGMGSSVYAANHIYAGGADWTTYPRIIDIAGSSPGPVTLALRPGQTNGLTGVDSGNAPALIHIVPPAAPIVPQGVPSPVPGYAAGDVLTVPAFTATEAAAGSLRCDGTAAITVALPPGFAWDGSSAASATGNAAMSLVPAATITDNVLAILCTRQSVDLGAHHPTSRPYPTPYQGAAVAPYALGDYTTTVPAGYQGDVYARVTVHLSDGRAVSRTFLFAKGPHVPIPAAGGGLLVALLGGAGLAAARWRRNRKAG